MNKDELINKALACFKMTVDVEGLTKLEKYISDTEEENKRLKEKVKSLNKGLGKLSAKRDKWKNRYYKEKSLHEYDERAVEKQRDFIDKHYAQQKEFINYLEEYINEEETAQRLDCVFTDTEVKEIVVGILCIILSKYKEITGKNE